MIIRNFRVLFCAIILFIGLIFISSLYPSSVKAQTGPSDPEQTIVRVMLVIYDPIMENLGGIRLHSWTGNPQKPWSTIDPIVQSNDTITDLNSRSNGKIQYEIVSTTIRDEFPLHLNGQRYTDELYVQQTLADNWTLGDGDYIDIINNNGIVSKINSGEVDEVWLWGGPGFGWLEATMAGPNAYDLNGPPVAGVSTNRAFPIMGLNYERTKTEVQASYGHRIEGVMEHIYGSWDFNYGAPPATPPAFLHEWNEYTAREYDPLSFSNCGFAHGYVNVPTYSPTQPNSNYTDSTDSTTNGCADWSNFPFLTPTNRTSITCSTWGCTEDSFYTWWFSHMPHIAGKYNDFAANWWRYIGDVNQYVTNKTIGPGRTTDFTEDIDFNHWEFDSCLGNGNGNPLACGTSEETTPNRGDGTYSRRFTINVDGLVALRYAPGNPSWNVNNNTVVFWAYSDNPNPGGFENSSPKVVLRTSVGNEYVYTPTTNLFNSSIGRWQHFEIPIAGNSQWVRTTVGSPSLSDIDFIIIKADTVSNTSTINMYFDGLGFEPNDTTSPTITLTSPANGANVSGITQVTSAVTDNRTIKRVDLLVDGVYAKTDSVAPYTFFWDTSAYSNGSHTLTTKAYDMDDNSTTSNGVSVNISGLSDLIFANNFESGDTSGWSSETDTENDLSVTSAAALHDTKGLAALIDNTTNMYVTNTTPLSETRYRARFYLDPNSITMASGDTFSVLVGRNSGGSAFHVQLNYSSTSGYRVRTSIYNDAATSIGGTYIPISDAPHSIEVDWKASSAAGANNGYITMWVDGVQQSNQTLIDNDTKRVDEAQFGAVANIDAGTSGTFFMDDFESRRTTYIGGLPSVVSDEIFADGFESGNTSAWSSETDAENDLTVTTAAAMGGTKGLSAVIDNLTSMYVSDLNPANETRYRARFYLDPNSITMASADTFVIFNGRTPSGSAFYVQLNYSSVSGYRLRTVIYDDTATGINGQLIPISDAPHSVEIDWQASSPGSNNGYMTMWIDGSQVSTQVGIDNDTKRVDEARLGAVTSVDAGTLGTIYFDRFDSTKNGYIGP